MVFTVLFFGASSSQAVHPERLSPDEMTAGAVSKVLASVRDLVLASSRSGGRIGSSRNALAVAKEKLDRHDFAAALASAFQGVIQVGQPGSPLASNLRDGFDFLVAACSAEQSGIDTRHAQDIFEAAAGDMGASTGVFESSWQALGEAIRHADEGARERFARLLRGLQPPPRALSLIGGA
ncbi:MAG TPA: hypothetical protein VJ547_09715 [Candidatus Thermoplasmatota archaeon]|nr:hypothetical protein [Candidatus Thermoplasmatota archaeon]